MKFVILENKSSNMKVHCRNSALFMKSTCSNMSFLFAQLTSSWIFWMERWSMLTDLYGWILAVSLSKLHHIRSTVKSACLVDCLLNWYVTPYLAESRLSANQNHIKHLNGPLGVNQNIWICHSSGNHKLLTTTYEEMF